MLQLIGWLGCLYLVVKALELAASSSFRDENGNMKTTAMAAAVLAWFGAAGFALLFLGQGAALQTLTPSTSEADDLSARIRQQCIELSPTPEEAEKCGGN